MTRPRVAPALRRVEPRFEDRTFWHLIVRRAEASPDGVLAVDEAGHTMTFAGYRASAERVAAALARSGVGSGSVVSWQLPNRLEALVLCGALARLGAVQNPLVPVYRDREVGFILEQTRAQLLVVPPVWRGHDYEAMAGRVVAGLDQPVELLVVDGVLPEADAADLAALVPEPPTAGPQPVRWIYYTSGSTGDPKGVRHTDATLGSAATAMVECLRMDAHDRNALVFPFAHIGGANFLMGALLAGCATICVEAFDPVTTIEVLRREQVTLAGAGTVFHSAYLAAQRRQPGVAIFPHLRACPGGAAPKPPNLHGDVQRELGGAGVVSAYGLTECQVIGMNVIDGPDGKLATTEGRPPTGVEVRVVAADGRRCGPNEEGELRVVAPQLFVGYQDPNLDADAIDADGWFRTGDLGCLDGEGYVTVTGRLKDVILRNGETISAKEIEDALHAHPAVVEVAVVAVPDPASGERCCAVVVPVDHGAPPSLADLATFLRGLGLMAQKIPEQLEIVDALPRAPAGKVLKQELRDRYGASVGP